MSKYLVAKKFFENIEEIPSTKFIVGKQHSENISQNNQFSVIKKQFKTKINLEFDSQGGTSHEQKEVVLGETYGELPVPTKSQNIFIGWFTDQTSGSQITEDSIVELNITKLYARWEYVQIDSDCTSYSVTTTSSYRNTGIYAASISNSSQPIYIDWGDGTVEKTNSSISQKSHTYKTNGNFTVKISNNITSFAPSYNNSTWYGTTSQNRYTFNGMLTTGSKVTSLPTYAFYYCQKMTNIDFMETCWTTVTSLPNYCFCYCTGLTSIQGAKRFTSLGSYCFQYCSGLTGIQDLSEFKFTTLPNSYTFANCTNVTQWILPDEFNGTSFGSYMFANNSKLNNVGNIEKTTQQLKAVQIEYLESTGTQWINTEADCGSLNFQIELNVQNMIQTGWVHQWDVQGTWIASEPSTNNIWYGNAGQAYNVEHLFNDNNVHNILYNSKQGLYIDSILRQSFNIEQIKDPIAGIYLALFCWYDFKISNYVVDSTSKAKLYYCKINVNSNLVRDLIPVRIGNVGYMYDKVSGKLFENQGTGNFILGPDKTDAEEITIEQEIITSKLPESLTSTGTYTFQNCSNLNSIIIIPSKVQSIGNYAFYGCTSLDNINIEATNLTAINQYAFYNCSKLTDLDLPDTIKTIGNYAFYGCTSLDYVGKKVEVEVPDEPEDGGQMREIEYLESTGTQWIDFIVSRGSNTGAYIDYTLLEDTASRGIFGSGAVNSSNLYDLKLMIVGSNMQRFDRYDRSTMSFLPNVSIRQNFTFNPKGSLDSSPYRYFSSLQGTIGQYDSWYTSEFSLTNTTYSIFRAFNRQDLLPIKMRLHVFELREYTSATNYDIIISLIPVRVGNVGYMYDKVSGQLFGNSGTGNFILGPDVKITSQYSEFPSQLTSIGSYAYQGCSNLKSLNIPENLQTIGDYAFAGCYQINSIVDKRLTAQTVSTNTFGSATGTSNTAFTGYQTRGNNILSTYFNVTGYDENAWDDPLQNPDKCGFVQQYIDPENVVSCTVTFDAGIGSTSEATRSIIKGKKVGELPTPNCPENTPYFGGWFTGQDGTGEKITKDYKVNTDIIFYALYSDTPFSSYEVILNDQWRASSKTNPDSSLYDGPYESNSNYNIGNKAAVMYIKLTGYTAFTIYLRSYAESSYDYALAFNLDTYTPSKPLTSNPSTGTSGVKAHTSSKQNSGTSIGSYTKVEYLNIDGEEHYICVAYRKDGSVNNGDDRGYVLIGYPPKEITIKFEIGTGSLVSGNTTIKGYQGGLLENVPTVTGSDDTPYFVGWYDAPTGGTRYSNGSALPSQNTLTLYAQYVSEKPPTSYEVDLNNQWRMSSSQPNPDSSSYDGVYESFSNHNVDEGKSKMYIRISGYDEFKIYIRSNAESDYDYMVALHIDQDVDVNSIGEWYEFSNDDRVKISTQGNQSSDQTINGYTEVVYDNLNGENHTICIVYGKDYSDNSGDDRGYVLIAKNM